MLRGIKNTSVSSHLTIEHKKNEKTRVSNLYLSFIDILKIKAKNYTMRCIKPLRAKVFVIINNCVMFNNKN